MAFAFDEKSMKEFQRWEKKFPANPDGKRSLVIPALWISQRQFGYINSEVVNYIATVTQTEPLHVWGVATFYTMFHKEKTGKHILQFCTNISCSLAGNDQLMLNVCKKLNVKPGQTTSDGLFTVLEVECLGACGYAPTLQVNETYHEKITEEEVERLISGIRSKAS